MQKFSRILNVGAVSALLLLGAAATGQAQNTIYGIGGTGSVPSSLSLFTFNSTTPGTLTTVGTVSGIASGYSLLGIDFRPSTGQLYGLAYNGTSTAQLYTLNISTAVATAIGGTFNVGQAQGGAGISIGIGFNPAVDLVRVVTGTNGNFRVDPTTGAIVTTNGVDGGLAYASNDSGASQSYQITDGDYTTDARLYDIDYIRNVLARQNPPNAGTLATVGGLGVTQVNGARSVGFDIDTNNNAFLSTAIDTDTGFQERLFNVNLANGTATSLGLIGTNTNFNTVDIAVQVPEPGTYALVGLGLGALVVGARRRRTASAAI